MALLPKTFASGSLKKLMIKQASLQIIFSKCPFLHKQNELLAAALRIPQSIMLSEIILNNWFRQVYPLPVNGRKLFYGHCSLCFDASHSPGIK